MNNNSDDNESDYSDTDSIDSFEEYINFKSIRVDGLEEAISFSWPGIYEESSDGGDIENDGEIEKKQLRKLVISTLLEEDDLAPLFDGSRWAGTRLWAAAVRAVQYINGRLPGTEDRIQTTEKDGKAISLLELGCGLGVPGMIFHLLGCNVVLTDQIEILSQLEKNVLDNFPNAEEEKKDETKQSTTIKAKPLSWSRTDVNSLLDDLGKSATGFDIVVNCDCVYEPLYGKSWHLLNETIDELLKVNPQTLVVSSMERRAADGIDLFIEEMENMEHVGSVEKVWSDDQTKIEIYITRGIVSSTHNF